MLDALRILPLVGVVPFPVALPYHVGCTGADAGKPPALVGLLHSGRHGLANAGLLARSRRAGGDVLCFEPVGRFRVLELTEDGTIGRCEALADVDIDTPEAHAHCAAVRQKLGELLRLSEDKPPARLATIVEAVTDDASAFSLSVAAALELETDEAQVALESVSCVSRLRMLESALDEALAYAGARAALRQLMGAT